jgi:SH3 domain-containing YSC84-like protein 1
MGSATWCRWLLRVPHTAAYLLAITALGDQPAMAGDIREARQFVDEARMTFERVAEDPNLGAALQALVQRAKGDLVFPQVLRGAFVVGAAGGSGVFLA